MNWIPSEASDIVTNADLPSPADGGPCATCAFRPGTDANMTPHTIELARMCVEGITPFQCHEAPQLCRGWTAAVNIKGAPETDEDRRLIDMFRAAAEILAECIDVAREEQVVV